MIEEDDDEKKNDEDPTCSRWLPLPSVNSWLGRFTERRLSEPSSLNC